MNNIYGIESAGLNLLAHLWNQSIVHLHSLARMFSPRLNCLCTVYRFKYSSSCEKIIICNNSQNKRNFWDNLKICHCPFINDIIGIFYYSFIKWKTWMWVKTEICLMNCSKTFIGEINGTEYSEMMNFHLRKIVII